jgi:uncharacterized membrane protein
MNEAHLHLLVNHVSFFALIFGVVALIVSMRRRSVDLRLFAVALFVIAAVFGWVADQTGEQAESVVKALGGDTESFIHQHEEAAAWALRSCTLVGCLAIALEWSARRKQKLQKALQWILLVFAIHGCAVFAATALLGGRIRHTETRE